MCARPKTCSFGVEFFDHYIDPTFAGVCLRNAVTTGLLERGSKDPSVTWQKKTLSAFYERRYNTTRPAPPTPPRPSTISPVETSDHAISIYLADGFFSHVALCRNGTSTHENTHGRLFKDITHSLSPSLPHPPPPLSLPLIFPVENYWKIGHSFPHFEKKKRAESILKKKKKS